MRISRTKTNRSMRYSRLSKAVQKACPTVAKVFMLPAQSCTRKELHYLRKRLIHNSLYFVKGRIQKKW